MALTDVPPGLAGLGVWLEDDTILGVKAAPWTVERYPADGGPSVSSVEVQTGTMGVNAFTITSALPGGRLVLATADSYEERGWQMNIALLDVATGELTALLPGDSPRWSPAGYIVFTRGDKLLAVGFDPETRTTRGGAVTIADGVRVDPNWVDGRISLAGGTLAYLAGGPVASARRLARVDPGGHVDLWSDEPRFFYGSPMVSPDGRLFVVPVVNVSAGLIEIWMSELDRPRLRPLIDEPGRDCTLGAWSPDGGRIAYRCTGADGKSAVYVKDVDGAGDPTLVFEVQQRDEGVDVTAFTPDGSAVLVTRSRGEPIDIVRIPVVDGTDPHAEPETILEDSAFARFSPDGRLLAYTAFGSGRPQVLVRAVGRGGRFEPGRPVLVGVGASPVWGRASAGGEHLLTWSDAEGFAVGSTPPIRTLREATVRTLPKLQASEPRLLMDAEEIERLGVFAWEMLPDGGELIIQKAREETEARQIQVVLDFDGELAGRVSPR